MNFGDIDVLTIDAPIETTGLGARGFHLYDGLLNEANFLSITTTGNGSVGVQVSSELPKLTITGDLTTIGGSGDSLVRGELEHLSASALTVNPTGHIGTVKVGGNISSAGNVLSTVDLEGPVDTLSVAGTILALGAGSTAVKTTPGITTDLGALVLEAPNGTHTLRQ